MRPVKLAFDKWHPRSQNGKAGYDSFLKRLTRRLRRRLGKILGEDAPPENHNYRGWSN